MDKNAELLVFFWLVLTNFAEVSLHHVHGQEDSDVSCFLRDMLKSFKVIVPLWIC